MHLGRPSSRGGRKVGRRRPALLVLFEVLSQRSEPKLNPNRNVVSVQRLKLTRVKRQGHLSVWSIRVIRPCQKLSRVAPSLLARVRLKTCPDKRIAWRGRHNRDLVSNEKIVEVQSGLRENHATSTVAGFTPACTVSSLGQLGPILTGFPSWPSL
jgi:hypothetical protein